MNIHSRITRSTTAASVASAAGASVNTSPPPPPPPPPSNLGFNSAGRPVYWPFPRPAHSPSAGSNRRLTLRSAALLAAAFALLAAAPASAAVLVSNIGQTTTWNNTLGSQTNPRAQQFTTGANSYTLNSIDIKFHTAVATPANLRVELWSATTGVNINPNAKLASLTVPATVGTGTVTFAAPAHTTLAASTRYFVVVYRNGATTGNLAKASSDAEDAGAATGWSIANGDHRIPTGLSAWSFGSSSLQIRVNGSAKTQPLRGGHVIWSATLTVDEDAGFFGCDNGEPTQDNCSTALSDDEFTYKGGTYQVTQLVHGTSSNAVTLRTNPEDALARLAGLELHLGTSHQLLVGADRGTFRWDNVNPQWTDNQQVAVRLLNPATLSALTAKSGTSAGGAFSALTLSPSTFAAATTAYTASVANSVTHLKLTPTAAQSGATLQVGKSGNLNSVASGADSTAIPLSVGANPILVEVTASGGAKNTYTVSVTRAAPSGSGQSANANLSALTAKSSTDGTAFTALALTPAFSASTTAYRASVGNEVTHAILTPTQAHNAASIRVGKSGSLTAVNSGADSSAISLAEGANAIVVEVTAENGSTTNYRVSITRAAIPTTLTLKASPTDIPEGGESVITAMLDEPAPTGGTTITLAIDPGNSTATEGADYTLATKTFTIAAGEHSEQITLRTLADEVDDDGETITINATSANPVLSAVPLPLTIVAALQAEQLHRAVLPEVARALAGRSTGAISARVGQVLNGGGASASLGGQSTLAGALQTHAPGLINENRPLRDLLSGSRFVLPLSDDGGGGGLRSASLWASGDYRNLSGEDGDIEFDGNLHGAQIGVDAMVRNNLLAGVALSWSEGELEYDTGIGGASGQGDYEVDVISLHPYLGGRSGQLDWWATLGHGNGELVVTPNAGQAASNDMSMTTLGAGGGGLLWSRAEDGAQVLLKGEFLFTWMDVEKSARVDSLSVNTSLARLALAASRTRSLAGGGQRVVVPSLSLGVRQDGGDGNTGVGAEIGGSVSYENAESGVRASVSAHSLFGRSDYEEWGIQALVHLSPGADGQGMSFEMSPGYGNGGASVGDTGRIWSHGLRGDATPANRDASGRLEMRLGYGLSAPGGRDGLLTPWSGLTLHETGKLYRLGLNWDTNHQFTLRLSGERRENENADTDHAVLLRGEARF